MLERLRKTGLEELTIGPGVRIHNQIMIMHCCQLCSRRGIHWSEAWRKAWLIVWALGKGIISNISYDSGLLLQELTEGWDTQLSFPCTDRRPSDCECFLVDLSFSWHTTPPGVMIEPSGLYFPSPGCEAHGNQTWQERCACAFTVEDTEVLFTPLSPETKQDK